MDEPLDLDGAPASHPATQAATGVLAVVKYAQSLRRSRDGLRLRRRLRRLLVLLPLPLPRLLLLLLLLVRRFWPPQPRPSPQQQLWTATAACARRPCTCGSTGAVQYVLSDRVKITLRTITRTLFRASARLCRRGVPAPGGRGPAGARGPAPSRLARGSCRSCVQRVSWTAASATRPRSRRVSYCWLCSSCCCCPAAGPTPAATARAPGRECTERSMSPARAAAAAARGCRRRCCCSAAAAAARGRRGGGRRRGAARRPAPPPSPPAARVAAENCGRRRAESSR